MCRAVSERQTEKGLRHIPLLFPEGHEAPSVRCCPRAPELPPTPYPPSVNSPPQARLSSPAGRQRGVDGPPRRAGATLGAGGRRGGRFGCRPQEGVRCPRGRQRRRGVGDTGHPGHGPGGAGGSRAVLPTPPPARRENGGTLLAAGRPRPGAAPRGPAEAESPARLGRGRKPEFKTPAPSRPRPAPGDERTWRRRTCRSRRPASPRGHSPPAF